MTSKKEQSSQNLQRFSLWLEDLTTQDKLAKFGKFKNGVYTLNRTKAASKCGFARSAFSTNPDFVKLANAFEEKHSTSKPKTENGETSTATTSQAASDAKDKEISKLRQRLHAKSVEAERLREELRQTRRLLDDIIPQGLPFPGRSSK